MTEKIVLVQGTFDGIYGWGKGFYTPEQARKWEEALYEINDLFWKLVVEPHSYGDTHYLVSTGGSVFLHPMDFRTVLHSSGCNTDDSFNCEELKKICEKIAEHCGGTFRLEVSKPFEVESELVPYEKGIHNTLGGW